MGEPSGTPSTSHPSPSVKFDPVVQIQPLDPSNSSDEPVSVSLEDLQLASPEEQSKKILSSFLRACSNGDLVKVLQLIKTKKDAFDINGSDDDGITGLIYAACFGHTDVAFLLLEHGAKVEQQDKNGWTALHWATNNNHDETVRLLLEAGADIDVTSKLGRSVRDFVEHGLLMKREKLVAVLASDTRSNFSASRSSEGSRGEGSFGASTTITTGTTTDGYHVPSLYGVDYAEMCDIVGTQIPSALQNLHSSSKSENGSTRSGSDGNAFELSQEVYLEEDEALIDFDYTTCQPDQMFVFSESDIPHLLNVTVIKLSEPQLIRSHNTSPSGFTRRPVSANVLFLAARYASYFCDQALLDKLLGTAIELIRMTLKNNQRDMMMMGYWLSNCSRLLYFLKKDSALVITTLGFQVQLNEMIQEIYQMLIRDAQNRLDAIIDESLLDHETIPGFDTIQFEKRKIHPSIVLKRREERKISRLSSYFSSSSSASTSPSSAITSIFKKKAPRTPRTITTILSSTLYVLQTFHIHPSLVHQFISQLFYYIGSTTFNRILNRPELCCRWKAIQIRMNLSHLEDWVRSNHIPSPSKDTFTKHLQPAVALLQLLQILTHLRDLSAFLEALAGSPHLSIMNWSHIRRALDLYTFEIDEPKVPEDIDLYVAEQAIQTELSGTQSIRDADIDDGMHNSKSSSPIRVSPRRTKGSMFDGTSSKKSPVDAPATPIPSINTSASADSSRKIKQAGPSPSIDTSKLSPTNKTKSPSSSSPLSANEISPVTSEQLKPMNKARGPVIAVSVPSNRSSPPTSGPPSPSRLDHQVSSPSTNNNSPRPVTPDQSSPNSAIMDIRYNFYMLDEKYYLPFAVPSNVGERVLLKIENGDEKYVEEAPVISEEVVKILDNKV